MKYYIACFVLLLLWSSCSKERADQNAQLPEQMLIRSIKAKLSAADFADLDISRMLVTDIDSQPVRYVRIPFRGAAMREHFILLETDRQDKIMRGRIIQLSGSSTGSPAFEGRINLESLDRKISIHSAVHGGYIEAFHSLPTGRTSSMLAPEQPDIITSYDNNGFSTDWLGANQALQEPDGSSGGIYTTTDLYVPLDGGSSGGTGGAIIVDVESQINNPAIDIEKYLKCFSSVPDAGAICSIEIFSDIPVDSDPNKLFNWSTESPGHSFIQLKKKNGAFSVLQNIGFYPSQQWKIILNSDPIQGKLVDNGGHEFNASLLMNLSPDMFQRVLNEILYLSRFIRYDMDEYNCTDFALEVFNSGRYDKLVIPKYDIPNGNAIGGTSTPQGLYHLLKQMQQDGVPEAVNISIPGVKGWVAGSSGPCN